MNKYLLLSISIFLSFGLFSQKLIKIGHSSENRKDDDIKYSATKLVNCEEIDDERDGNTYSTVLIGSQCWMAENLKFLPLVTGPNFEWNDVNPQYSVYGYTDEVNSVEDAKLTGNYNNYGVLYNWDAAVSACPEGWHLPNEFEWIVLEEYLLNEYNIANEDTPEGAGNALKSCRQQNSVLGGDCDTDIHPRWNENSENSGTDNFDFSALPGGLRSSTGINNHIGISSYFWMDIEDNEDEAKRVCLNNSAGNIQLSSSFKTTGYAIRCLKDISETATAPSITTKIITNLTQISFSSGGIINDDGGCSIIKKGIVISNTPNPTVSNNIFLGDAGSGNQEFDLNVEGLEPGLDYYIRAFVINLVDTTYGQEISFTTLQFENCGQINDSRDGNVYSTIKIGMQCWMAEPLKYLPEVTGNNFHWGLEAPQFSVYGYADTANSIIDAKSLDNYENYGVLYNWYSAQTACPEGWHLPDLTDNLILLDYLSQTYGVENENIIDGAGNALKSCRQHETSFGCNCNTDEDPYWGFHSTHFGTNKYGFAGLPCGYRNADATFDNRRNTVYYWMTTEAESNDERAYCTRLHYSAGNLYVVNFADKKLGGTVRCIKDTDIAAVIPSIETNNETDITPSTVLVGGSNIINGGDQIITKGIVYSTSANPTLENNEGFTNHGYGDLAFESTLYGLSENSTYYVRAYAQNSVGVGYGNEIVFVTDIYPNCGILTDSRDANTYKTVTIGNQCWMAEDLRFLPEVTGANAEWDTDEPGYAVYGYTGEENSVIDAILLDTYQDYGALYNWSAAQTACPGGWHLPTVDEWQVLLDYMYNEYGIENQDVTNGACTALKSCRLNNSPLGCSCNAEEHPFWIYGTSKYGQNLFGFSSIPSGQRRNTGIYQALGSSVCYWTPQEDTDGNAFCQYVYNSYGDVRRMSYDKKYGLSIRCVKDYDPLASLPIVETISVVEEGINFAIVESNVSNNGGAVVFERGIVYSLSSNPELEFCLGKVSNGTETGSFVTSIYGLNENTTYYVRAYAINTTGTSYGEELFFTTSEIENCGVINDTRDGNSYKTVMIGSQCWMAENLKYLPEVTGSDDEWGFDEPQYAVYDYESSDNSVSDAINTDNYQNYGVLYNWHAALDACPDGWTLPDSLEWDLLVREIEVNYGILNENTTTGVANCLKSCRQTATPLECECLVAEHPVWTSVYDYMFGTDIFGFSAIPGGYRRSSGNFSYIGVKSVFWTNDEYDEYEASNIGLYTHYGSLNIYEDDKTYGYSIRCLKEEDVSAGLPTLVTHPVIMATNIAANFSGEIISPGGYTIFKSGIVINTEPNPAIEQNLDCYINEYGTSIFNFYQSGLMHETTYYVRAFALTQDGYVYGNEVSFETGSYLSCGDVIDNRDGEVYKTVQIGQQCWLAENLRYLPTVTGPNGEVNIEVPQYYVYGYTSADNSVIDAKETFNYQTYGVLYNYLSVSPGGFFDSDTMLNIQGVCPTGWHIPSDADWRDLEMHLGLSEVECGQYGYRGEDIASMLAGNCYLWNDGALEEVDVFGNTGFDALPAGDRSSNGGFYNIGNLSNFWSSSVFETSFVDNLIYRMVSNNNPGLYLGHYYPNHKASSLRCVMNSQQEIFLPVVVTSNLSHIDEIAAFIGGTVVTDGGDEVVERGVVWNTTPEPSLDENINFTTDGSGTGYFNSAASGLVQGETYYFRAYATNSLGTAYGNDVMVYADFCSEMNLYIESSEPHVGDQGFIDICWDVENSQSYEVVLTATCEYPDAMYPLDDQNVNFRWEIDDNDTIIEGLGMNSISYIFPETGGYHVKVEITDMEGCENTNTLVQQIRVSIPPDWDVDATNISFSEILQGQVVELCTNYSSSSWEYIVESYEFSNPDTIPIADHMAEDNPTISTVNVSGFQYGQTFGNADELNSVSLNIAHSFLGDLTFFIECPNGQTVQLHEQGGGSLNLGNPPDEGFWYTFNSDAEYTLLNYVSTLSSGDIVEGGDYLTTESFEVLSGCPLNGEWSLFVWDNWSADVGTLFGWELDFNETAFSYDPWTYNSNFENIGWSGDYGASVFPPVDSVCAFGTYFTTENPLETTMQNFYFEVIDDFGCIYDTSLNIIVLGTEGGEVPTVELNSVSSLTSTSVFASATVIDEGDYSLISKGLIWSMDNTPTVDNCLGISNEGSGLGEFSGLISGLTPNQTYYIRAYGVNNSGVGYSEILQVDVISKSIFEENGQIAFEIFPNPTKGKVKIISAPLDSYLEIYEMSGRFIQNYKLNGTQEIDVKAFAPGEYLLVLFTKRGEIGVQKLIKK